MSCTHYAHILKCCTLEFFLLAAGLFVAASEPVQAQTLKTLYTFTGGADGVGPFDSLILKGSNLYGAARDGSGGGGVVFDVTKTGTETTLYSFSGGADGNWPQAPLVRDAKGNLYGTTENGGASGYGTVFKVDQAGQETVLYSFQDGRDGCFPNGGLDIDGEGNLYGTAYLGGESNGGTVFEITPAGTEITLYAFNLELPGVPDGYGPAGGLLRDSKGNLYGTTSWGGAYAWGTVFELVRSKKTYSEKLLYSFTGDADGKSPNGSLISDEQGNLYGTTPAYPQSTSYGTVFELTQSGLVILHAFTGAPDGQNPSAGLVRDKAGNLYGTTSSGGSGACVSQGIHGCGIVFQLTPAGNEIVLYSFSGEKDGAFPYGGLVGSPKALYGTTLEAGDLSDCDGSGCGTVFKLVP